MKNVALFSFILILTSFLYAGRVQEIEKELLDRNREMEELKSQIEEGKNKLKQIKKEEQDVLNQLDQIDDNLRLSRLYLTKLNEKEGSITEQIHELETQLTFLQDSLVLRSTQMKKRLRSIYKQGQPSLLESLLKAQSLAYGFERYRFFQSLNQYDRDLLNNIKETRAQVETSKNEMNEKLEEVRSVQKEKEKEKHELENQKDERHVLLTNIQSKKSTYERMVEDLKESQKTVNSLIALLEDKKKKVSEAEKRKKELSKKKAREREEEEEKPDTEYRKKMVWPVSGPILRQFGQHRHPKYKTITMNSGIDIQASEGDPVVATLSGTVVYSGQLRGYGNFVIIEHEGGFYSLYAHLSEMLVKAQQNVESGQIIGRAGDSGSFEGVKVHFEFRKGKDVLDPEDWLPVRKR